MVLHWIRITHCRLMKFLLPKHLISSCHYRFRPCSSTQEDLLSVTNNNDWHVMISKWPPVSLTLKFWKSWRWASGYSVETEWTSLYAVWYHTHWDYWGVTTASQHFRMVEKVQMCLTEVHFQILWWWIVRAGMGRVYNWIGMRLTTFSNIRIQNIGRQIQAESFLLLDSNYCAVVIT